MQLRVITRLRSLSAAVGRTLELLLAAGLVVGLGISRQCNDLAWSTYEEVRPWR
jgi:hypothetical protein